MGCERQSTDHLWIGRNRGGTIQVPQGCGSRRRRVHLCGGLRQQPNPDLQPGRHLPQSLWPLGSERRGIQGSWRHRREQQGKHSGRGQREPSYTDLLIKHPTNLSVSIYLTNITNFFLEKKKKKKKS